MYNIFNNKQNHTSQNYNNIRNSNNFNVGNYHHHSSNNYQHNTLLEDPLEEQIATGQQFRENKKLAIGNNNNKNLNLGSQMTTNPPPGFMNHNHNRNNNNNNNNSNKMISNAMTNSNNTKNLSTEQIKNSDFPRTKFENHTKNPQQSNNLFEPSEESSMDQINDRYHHHNDSYFGRSGHNNHNDHYGHQPSAINHLDHHVKNLSIQKNNNSQDLPLGGASNNQSTATTTKEKSIFDSSTFDLNSESADFGFGMSKKSEDIWNSNNSQSNKVTW